MMSTNHPRKSFLNEERLLHNAADVEIVKAITESFWQDFLGMNQTNDIVLIAIINRDTWKILLEDGCHDGCCIILNIHHESIRTGTITSRAISSSKENTPWSISISSASKVFSLFVKIYSISSRVICSSASSKFIGVIRLIRFVAADNNHTNGLTIFQGK